jgi:hypothetical protein
MQDPEICKVQNAISTYKGVSKRRMHAKYVMLLEISVNPDGTLGTSIIRQTRTEGLKVIEALWRIKCQQGTSPIAT